MPNDGFLITCGASRDSISKGCYIFHSALWLSVLSFCSVPSNDLNVLPGRYNWSHVFPYGMFYETRKTAWCYESADNMLRDHIYLK